MTKKMVLKAETMKSMNVSEKIIQQVQTKIETETRDKVR